MHIVGRGKDLIISGGLNIYPKEIEGEIDAMPGVVESAVIGLPDADFGEAVAAIVVREKGATINEADIRAALADRLAKFKWPKKNRLRRRPAAQHDGQGAEERVTSTIRK